MWHEEILSDSIELGDTEGVVEAFPFIEYALQYVWLHAAIVTPCSSEPYCPGQFEDVWISLYYSLGLAEIDENKLAASLFYLFSGRPSAFRHIRNLCLTRGYKPTLLSVATDGVRDGTPLLVACGGPGYKGVIEPLLKGGADVTSTDPHGRTPLLRAASWSHEAVKLLLDYGAEVNVSCAFGLTPLIIAIRFRQKETVRLLLSRGADVNATDDHDESPLFFAVRYGYSEILELLLNQKTAEVDKQNPLGETPLLIATSGIESQVLRQLLIDHGASDNSALKIVEEVIKWGNGNNVMNLLLGEPDKRWVEHFSLALGFWERTREARMLSPSYEGDKKQDFREWQWNAERNKEEMVKMLLKHGASVDIADNDGMTPLKLAAAWRNTKIEKLLQDRGATGSVVDNEDVMQID
ncbi:hypothetical protein NUW58_g7025 [Xylaria curta]|uniref:Uncharacterized protein n=1 Tax=Xylaria curta TaxID=42375 RepID=A0ACC1NP72_9PEZI|nr:hypothetical protein NUW58_g7025 [Xylaria curta]